MALIYSASGSGLDSLRKEIPTTPGALQYVSPSAGGPLAAKFTLNRTDNDVETSKRCELAHQAFKQPAKRFYGWRLMVPGSFAPDSSFDIVSQWHDYPDFALGETWRSPPLHLEVQADRWWLVRIWDPNALTLNNTPGPGGGKVRVDLGPVKKGTWTSFMLEINWTHQSSGSISLWMNGVNVYSATGPTTYNDQTGPYFKFGIYKPDWKYAPQKSTTNQRIIYADYLKVGDELSSLTEISFT